MTKRASLEANAVDTGTLLFLDCCFLHSLPLVSDSVLSIHTTDAVTKADRD